MPNWRVCSKFIRIIEIVKSSIMNIAIFLITLNYVYIALALRLFLVFTSNFIRIKASRILNEELNNHVTTKIMSKP